MSKEYSLERRTKMELSDEEIRLAIQSPWIVRSVFSSKVRAERLRSLERVSYLLTPLRNPPRCAANPTAVTPSSSIGMR